MIFQYRNYFHDGLALLRKLTIRRIWNYIKIVLSYRFSMLRKRPYIWAGPFSLSFETASVCNLACPECRAGQGKVMRNRKLMKPELADKLLKRHRNNAFYCNLYFQGEPFLHPEIYSFIRQAGKRKYYSVISTNGHFLDENTCRKIIDSGLNRLIVSLDGIEQQSYQAYRKGGDLQKVVSGIKRLSAMKKESQSPYPFLIVQFLVNKTNEHQLGEVAAYVRQLGADKLAFKSMQIYTAAGKKKFIPGGNLYNRYSGNPNSPATPSGCFRLWSHMVVTSDGDWVPCCYDKIPEYGMKGGEKSSMHIWKDPVMQDFRKALLTGERLPSVCSNCGE